MNREKLKEYWMQLKEKFSSARSKITSPEFKEQVRSRFSREELTGLITKIQNHLPKDVDSFYSVANQAVDQFKKLKFTRHGKILTVGLCTWFMADLSALLLQEYIPEPPPPLQSYRNSYDAGQSGANYDVIFGRNLFSSLGLIPGEETERKDGPAVKSSLPFNLVGTMILTDELKSLATIEDKSNTTVYPVRVEDEIPQKVKITKVEARRVTFVNLSNNRNEYIELPEDLAVSNPIITIKPRATIEKISTNRFHVPKKEIDAAMSDINSILTQARAVPNWENGVFSCYKLFQIVPNSIYDKLGLKNGDCVVGADGETIADPAKAFEIFMNIKDKANLDLKIKRNGKDQVLSYDIN